MASTGLYGLKFKVYTATDTDVSMATDLGSNAAIYAIASTGAGDIFALKDASAGNVILRISGADGLLVLPEPLGVGVLVADVTVALTSAVVYYINKE